MIAAVDDDVGPGDERPRRRGPGRAPPGDVVGHAGLGDRLHLRTGVLGTRAAIWSATSRGRPSEAPKIEVAIRPGQMALTRIFLRRQLGGGAPRSCGSRRPWPPNRRSGPQPACRPAIEAVLMIEPPPRSSISGMACFMPSAGPRTSRSKIQRPRPRPSISDTLPGMPSEMPALLNRMSRPPNSVGGHLHARRRCPLRGSRRSGRSGRGRGTASPAWRPSRPGCRRRPPGRPPATNSSTVPRPMPETPPVITATLPSRRPAICPLPVPVVADQ